MKPARPSLFCLWLVTTPALAGSSASYSLTPEAVDGGGLRGTSASYSISSSVTPGGPGASAAYAVRSGFAGQIADLMGSILLLAASPLTVNEGGTRQLTASLSNDDGSRTPLPPGDITWTVQSGPLTGVSASGLVTAGLVYEDTDAVVRGTYQSLGGNVALSVLNILPDNFGSYAGDGLDDAWQVLHFGLNNPSAAPLLDPDGDGWTNRFEYDARLVPTDPLSTFSFHISEVTGGGHAVNFSPRFPDCAYSLMGSSDLSLWSSVAGTISDTGSLRTILEPGGDGPRRFYYLDVRRE